MLLYIAALTIVNRLYIYRCNILSHGGYVMADVSSRCYPLILCLSYLCGHGRKSYSYPTQSTLCQLLSRHYGVSISRRTLCRWMSCLESAGYIRRVRRIRRGLGGSPEFTSSLYLLHAKARRLIRRLARSTAALAVWAKESWSKAKAVIHKGLEVSRGQIDAASEAWAIQAAQHALEAEAKAKARAAERLKGLDLNDPIKAMMQILVLLCLFLPFVAISSLLTLFFWLLSVPFSFSRLV
jgi:hypothetical protein